MSTQNMCLLAPRDAAQYCWQNGETSLPAFFRMCPSGLNGLNDPNMEGSGGSRVGAVHCQMGHVLAIGLLILFMPGVTMALTRHCGFPPAVNSLMSIHDDLTICSLGKEVSSVFMN